MCTCTGNRMGTTKDPTPLCALKVFLLVVVLLLPPAGAVLIMAAVRGFIFLAQNGHCCHTERSVVSSTGLLCSVSCSSHLVSWCSDSSCTCWALATLIRWWCFSPGRMASTTRMASTARKSAIDTAMAWERSEKCLHSRAGWEVTQSRSCLELGTSRWGGEGGVKGQGQCLWTLQGWKLWAFSQQPLGTGVCRLEGDAVLDWRQHTVHPTQTTLTANP